MPQLQGQFNDNVAEIRVWMSNYISLFYMDVIIYPCRNPDARLAHFRQ